MLQLKRKRYCPKNIHSSASSHWQVQSALRQFRISDRTPVGKVFNICPDFWMDRQRWDIYYTQPEEPAFLKKSSRCAFYN
jgi:hypothetical protein